MALSTVHLAVVHRWAQRHIEYADCPELYLGAISPDAIQIRDGKDKSRKDYFHLHNWLELHPEEVYAYWQHHRSVFDVGYGLHVLTDALWTDAFHKIPELFREDGSLIVVQYYHDTYLTDFVLFHQECFGAKAHSLLRKSTLPKDHPLLSAEEFDRWRTRTLNVYSGECPETGTSRILTVPYVNAFMEEIQPQLDAFFAHCFPGNA